VLLAAGSRVRRLRLTRIDDAGARAVEAVATDPSVYEPFSGPPRAPGAGQGLSIAGRPLVVFLDLPLLTGEEIPWAPHAAAFASPWPGAVPILRSAGSANFKLDTSLARPAAIGETTADFFSGPTWRWDEAGALEIRLYNGACASLDDLSVLGGANALAVENEDGDWEVLQYAQAELTAPNRWRLTRLLRAQAGTQDAMRGPVAAGARVVLLDRAPVQLALRQDERLLPFNYLYGPQGRPVSDPAWRQATLAFAGVGLRPLSPVHLDARWQDGDLVLTWVRRTRIGGDSWDQTDVPLAEETEEYEVAIGARVATVSEPRLVYTAAEIAEDGGVAAPLRFSVAQLSTTYGRGAAAEAEVWFA